MIKDYNHVVSFLENLQIMPKTMPGLDKIKQALNLTDWYQKINPEKVIVVAGTNGKGTTCAALEALLIEADQKVGFYSSPHLISTTERIRLNGKQISKEEFVVLFNECFPIIKDCHLSHFEALTFMAGHYFFGMNPSLNLDFVIFEVGLGGTYDATNAFPHKYSIITKLGLDHVNILGNSLVDIAKNKFGIIAKKNIVVHQPLSEELYDLKKEFQKNMNSNWVESEPFELQVEEQAITPQYFIKYNNTKFKINIPGKRAAENIMTALTMFQILGFYSENYYSALNKIQWSGRMQYIQWPSLECPLYVSGDHNEQGIQSLIEILNDFKWQNLYLVVGIGVDKDAELMLQSLCKLKNLKLFLTETPFKGLKLNEYPDIYSKLAVRCDSNCIDLLNQISKLADSQDLVLVTGSLYLVGSVLSALEDFKKNL